MKRIMSGRQFARFLRYLHVCDDVEPPADEYDPAYKVAAFRDRLQELFNWLFVPSRRLSLDETLVRTFGRIRFKVRIISKSARYGIKIYVLTDAETAFVLKVVIYTGKYMYEKVSRRLCRL